MLLSSLLCRCLLSDLLLYLWDPFTRHAQPNPHGWVYQCTAFWSQELNLWVVSSVFFFSLQKQAPWLWWAHNVVNTMTCFQVWFMQYLFPSVYHHIAFTWSLLSDPVLTYCDSSSFIFFVSNQPFMIFAELWL